MGKELESLEKIKQEFNCDPEYYGLGGAFEILESALYRLESIDNAEPSEALEELIDMIEYFTRLDYVEPIVRNEIHDKFKDIYWHKLPHLDSIKEALLKAQKLEKENAKYKQLEEQIGCPLEVVLGFLTHSITEIIIEYDHFSGNYASPYCTDEDIVKAYVSSIYDRNEIDGISEPELVVETNMGTFPLSDYKEHWWLKEDKSE